MSTLPKEQWLHHYEVNTKRTAAGAPALSKLEYHKEYASYWSHIYAARQREFDRIEQEQFPLYSAPAADPYAGMRTMVDSALGAGDLRLAASLLKMQAIS